MRVEWNPKHHMVPFVGVCWWDGEVIVALWPLVLRFGRAPSLAGWVRVEGIDGYVRERKP